MRQACGIETHGLAYRQKFVRQVSLARRERRSRAITLKFENGTQQVQVLPS
jgi:hypothetical protein